MTVWRMAFRCRLYGSHPMWPACRELGVAAIAYDPLEHTDLSAYPQGEPKELWDQLASSQKSSLKKVAYEMAEGDVIYVKDGPAIVCRGVVTGPYQFDHEHRIRDPYGTYWNHQVPVDWDLGFRPVNIVLGADLHTVLRLSGERLDRLEQAIAGNRQPTC